MLERNPHGHYSTTNGVLWELCVPYHVGIGTFEVLRCSIELFI